MNGLRAWCYLRVWRYDSRNSRITSELPNEECVKKILDLRLAPSFSLTTARLDI
jgi:hypothetical protein